MQVAAGYAGIGKGLGGGGAYVVYDIASTGSWLRTIAEPAIVAMNYRVVTK